MPVLICSVAFKIAIAMGKSKRDPSFFMPDGARFIVYRRDGNSYPQFFMAARTLSRASFTAASGRPTISNAGSP